MPEGKPIPTELRNEEAALRQEIDLEDEQTAGMSLFYFIFFPTLFVRWEIAERKIWRWKISSIRRLRVIHWFRKFKLRQFGECL